MSTHVNISSFGGSGENGRNCYCIEYNNQFIILDCGVKREIIDGTVGFYPHITEEILSKTTHVFLSHCHEDHVAALPLLYHLGYTGKIYATKETIAETKGFVKKWMTFVEKQNGVLPYTVEDFEKLTFEEIHLGTQTISDFEVTLGRSGHVLGSSWYVFNINDRKILYTGDMVLQSASLATDIPGIVDAAIMNGAYAGKQINQQEQYKTLLTRCKETLADHGSVLLPIPPKGRGIDMTLFLDQNLEDGTIYVEEAVITSMNNLLNHKDYINETLSSHLTNKVHIIKNKEDRQLALQNQPAIYITGDGMLTTDVALEYYEVLKSSFHNLIIISGHAATGTVGAGVLDNEYRSLHNVNAKAEKIIFKVHLDDNDIYSLCMATKPKNVILFHADASNNVDITKRLAKDNILAHAILYPNKILV